MKKATDVWRTRTRWPDELKLWAVRTDLPSLTADTNMFWNHIQHRRELYHFRLHWLPNTAKSRWLICLKRKTLTAPNRGPPLKTYVYLWSCKLLFKKKKSLLYTTSINAVIRLGVQKHHEFPSANWSWKPRHTFHQGRGPTCRSKARREIPPVQQPQEAQHTPRTVPQAQPTATEAVTTFLGQSHIPHQLHLGQPLQLHQESVVFFTHFGPPAPSQQCTGTVTRVNNSLSTQKARLALVFLTIYFSSGRNWDCKGSAESSTFKVITSHFPTILLENIALRCCSCSPPPPHIHSNSFLPQ